MRHVLRSHETSTPAPKSLSWLLCVVAGLGAVGCQDVAAPTPEGGAAFKLAPSFGVNAAVPPSFSDVQVVAGLANPTLMAIAPDGRIFVSEQGGKVRVIKNGVLLATAFVTLNVNASGERGALGIAFDPAFSSNRFVYVYYTSSSGPHNRVSRFTASGDVASGGETILLDLPTLGATNHNGGAIHFGADGKLYIAVGENANGNNAQSMTTPLGKMLRINSDGSIPGDNPFFGSTTGINQSIWALGLRNPFTFAFQPGTGRLFINDVGEQTWEEIDEGLAGANYGWPATEGNTSNPSFKSPFYTYNHASTGGCAITGGDFYNPTTVMFPAAYVGDYFFADYCGGFIKSIDLTSKAVTNLATGIASPTDLAVGNDGALYYIARGSGSIRKITYTSSGAPSILQHPADQSVAEGAGATFSVVASGSAPLSYQWQRNQANIAGANSASYTLNNAQLSDNGARFRCVVTNSVSSATSNEAALTVTSNQAPTAAITGPAAGTPFQGGQTINYAGTGNDPEDGILPAAAFTWEILLWHNDTGLHSHPAHGPVSGAKTGSFTIPTQGETSPNIWYRIYLTVRDSKGASHKDSVDIQPRTVSVTLATNPAGLQLNLDGTPGGTPRTFTGVVGIQRVIGAVSPQTLGGQTWQFASWSDGGAASHTISTPSTATTYTATFTPVSSSVHEAENAFLSGAVISAQHAGYTGTGYVAYPNPSTDYVKWTVNVTHEGTKSLDFRYALGSATPRSLQIILNGKIVKPSVAFAPTGAWTTWNVVTVTLRLTTGVNNIRATAIGTGGPNLDHLVVR